MNNISAMNLSGGGTLVQAGPVQDAELVAFERNQPERLPILRQSLAILRRRKWIIAGAIVTAMIVAAVITMLMTPLYTASTLIEIQREGANIVKVEDVEAKSNSLDEEFYQTQYGLLRARSLAEGVARNLRLSQDAAFLAAFDIPQVENSLQDAGRVSRIADVLLKHIKISPVRMSRLVEVSFTSPSPELSEKIVNAWSTQFIEQALARRVGATDYARQFLEERLAQVRGNLERSERDVVSYAALQGIVNLAVNSPTEEGATVERPLVADQLTALNTELQRATADRIAAQSRLQPSGASQNSLTNSTIAGLRQRRAELAAERSRLLVQFTEEWPQARALGDQVAQLDRAIATEEARVRSAAQNDFRAATAREQSLNQQVEGLKQELLGNRARSIQYNIYTREVDTNRQLYQDLLQRYKEIGVAGQIGVNNIAVVDKAEVPKGPSSPNLILNLLIALVAGTALGVGLALALEQIDEAVADPNEIESKLQLPVLGTAPKVVDSDLREELADRKSSLAEAYWSVHASLGFSTDHGVPKSLVVTSTRPAEGKSTTCYAIASSLARTGSRVLLIDGDMRSPSMHHMFEIGNEAGLSNYLSGTDDLAKLIKPNFADGLSIMTAGPQPPNAAELLTGSRLAKLLETLRPEFDHVIIDAPPVMGLADAPLLTSRVEGTIYVIESHGIRLSMVKVALNRLRAAQAHLLGCVLTKFESKRAHYGYGYDYGYGYGEAGKKGSTRLLGKG